MNDRPNRFDVLPPVVKNLLIINGLMFAASAIFANKGIDLHDYFALYSWQSEKFRIWQPITHMFFHGSTTSDLEGGFMHLFSNMFALWMFGSALEHHFGSKRFLLFYLACGIGASVIFMGIKGYEYHCLKHAILVFDNNPTFKEFSIFLKQNHATPFAQDPMYDLKKIWEANPMDDALARQAVATLDSYYKFITSIGSVGASGAVFGILFGFGFLYPNVEMLVLFAIPVKIKYLIAIYVVIELVAGLVNNPNDNIAHFAHLGGMIIAYILLKIWKPQFNK